MRRLIAVMEQKLIAFVSIMCFSVFIASLIKFSAKKLLNGFSAMLSIFVPIFLVLFWVHFSL